MPSFEHEELLAFEGQEAFATWLAQHHARKEPLWILYAKKGKGVPSITYAEAVEVALIWGWIDGLAGRIDDAFYKQRFTPRGQKSLWSKINCVKAMTLIAQGRMQPSGLAEVERAKADGRWDRAYASPKEATPGADFDAALDASPKARAFFDALDSQNRYAYLHRLNITVKADTRAKKIVLFVGMLERHEKFYERDAQTKKLIALKKGSLANDAVAEPTKKAPTKRLRAGARKPTS